jgi:GDP-L-fucose synthase
MKLFIAGHNGMVGGALVRRFQREPGVTLLLRTRQELDLTSQAAVAAFLAAEKPDAVIMAAAKVGGIHANNTYPAEFLHDNLAIANNTIHGAYARRREAPPLPRQLLHLPEARPAADARGLPAHRSAGADQRGLRHRQDRRPEALQYYRKQYGVLFHSAMPTNLYGPGDNYHPQNSHVLPALIRASTRRSRRARPRSPPGAPVRRGASSCTWTTSPTPAPSCSEYGEPARPGSTSAPAPT